jgi:hypothetical protein
MFEKVKKSRCTYLSVGMHADGTKWKKDALRMLQTRPVHNWIAGTQSQVVQFDA